MDHDRYMEIISDRTLSQWMPYPDPSIAHPPSRKDWAFVAAHMPMIADAERKFRRAGMWNTSDLVILLPHRWIQEPQAFGEKARVFGMRCRVVFGIDDVMVALDVTR